MVSDVTAQSVRAWLRGDVDTPPCSPQALAEAFLLAVQREAQVRNSVQEAIVRYSNAQGGLINKVEQMPEGSARDEATRYIDYISAFLEMLYGINQSTAHAEDWVKEYLKTFQESLAAHRKMVDEQTALIHKTLLAEQAELVRKTDYAFGTLKELRDYEPGKQSFTEYRKKVKKAASWALQEIEGVRIQ